LFAKVKKPMRRCPLILMAFFGVAASLKPALADPFNGTLVTPARANDMFLMPNGLVAWLAHIQMQLNDVISREFRSVHHTGSILAVLTILGLAFLYGAVHAAVPGHGKTIVGSYFVANQARWLSGFFMGGLISMLKGATAIAIVIVMSVVLHMRELETANQGAVIGTVSYALVVVIGCMVFWRAATGRDCGHSHGLFGPDHDHGALHDHTHGPVTHRHTHASATGNFQRVLIAITGIVPCSSAIIIMLFALANNVMAMGIAAVLALSLGMALTISAVGMVGIAARPVLVRIARGSSVHLERAERTVRLLGATAMVGFAGLLMIGAMSRI
jgi:nickel/cobalt transporter (NicO) family protein